MKLLVAMALLLTLGSAAGAKPDPVTAQDLLPPGTAAAAIVAEPVETMMESEYFRAPRNPSRSGHLFSCQLRQLVFGKARIALACN